MQMDYETLSALCAQFQNGDEQAFAGLYEAMYGPMRGFALIRLAHDAHAAEDAVQDAFIEIYRGIGSLKDPQAFPKWANTILARVCAKKSAKAGREALLDEEAEGLFDNIPYDEEEFLPGFILERQQSRLLILEIMDELPDLHREALTLRYLSDMPIADMAAALEVPEGTIKSRLNHAKKAMRRRVEAMREKGVVFGVAPVFVLSQVLRDGSAAFSPVGFTEVWASVAAKTGCTAIVSGAAAAAAEAAATATEVAAEAAVHTAATAEVTGAAATATSASTAATVTTTAATTAATAATVTAKAAGAAISGKAMALILAGTLAVGGGVGVGVGVTMERQQPRPAISAQAEQQEGQELPAEQDVLLQEQNGSSAESPHVLAEETPIAAETPAPMPEAAVAAAGVLGNTAHNLAAGGGMVAGENGVVYAYGCFVDAARSEDWENHPLFKDEELTAEEERRLDVIWENVGIYELRPDKSARLLCKAGDSDRSNLNYFDGQLYFTEYNKIYRLDPTTGQLTLLYEIEDSIRTLVVVDGIAYWLETNYNGYSAINKSGLDDFANMTLCKGLNAANISYWNGMLYVLVIDYSDDIYTEHNDAISLYSLNPHSGDVELLIDGLPFYDNSDGWGDSDSYFNAENGNLQIYCFSHPEEFGISPGSNETMAYSLADRRMKVVQRDEVTTCEAAGIRYGVHDSAMSEGGHIVWPDGTEEHYAF